MALFTLFGVNGNAATGPSAAAAYSGAYQAGVIFKVTAGNKWLTGYWWWCCNTGQQTGAVTFALWEPVNAGTQVLVPNSSVTSGTLTAGAWNYTALAAPIALSQNVAYTAVVGYTSTTGFPFTTGQFGSGQTYGAGITNGALAAYSDSGGSNPPPASQTQGLFGTGSASGASASANYPNLGSDGSANFWMDLQITDVAPAGASYQLTPSQPYPINYGLDTADNFTLGVEFVLSQKCTLNQILYYSPATVTQLATECGIWTVPGASLIAATHLTSPSWSGAAGSGWVSVTYSPGVTLLAGEYKCAVFNGAASPQIWNATTGPHYWESPGPAPSGITNGPLSAPNTATATSPGQSTYHLGASFAFPDTNVGAYTYWLDLLVAPAPGVTASGSLLVAPSFSAVPRVRQSGSWWQLLDVRKHAQEEFEFYASRPPQSCPRCGEPLLNAPPTDAGSETELYCRFDGWRYPQDWVRPQAT